MKKLFATLIIALGMLTSQAWALNLDEAKSGGMVGETPSGYLEAVGNQSDAVKNLVKNINGKRKAQYKSIAQKNGASLQAVEALAGEKAMKAAGKGHFIKVNGKWVKK